MSLATLDEWIRDLRAAGEGIKEAAPEIAARCKAASDEALASGQGIGGDAWVPRKDGGKPLANAASAVTVRAVDNVIVFELRAPEVYHHFGAGGKPQRPILPLGGLPDRLGNAIQQGLIEGLPFMKKHGRGK